jgi:hypothetical protein
MKNLFVGLFLAIGSFAASAQKPEGTQLPLQDMSAFKPQAGNWQIVGDVTMDPTVEIHHEKAVQPAVSTEKKKKKSDSSAQIKEEPKAVTFQPGTGILLNINDDSRKDNLITNWEHGNIDLELEVMLPKGSNSGIYLQGRYELQLLDSWGVKNPKFSDIGGIYRNWESEPGKIYMGKAPLSNPAKAPGLWQKLKISFKAPRFDAAGKKIANAMFESVYLNGVKIHDHVEVPLPTGGPIENNEKPTGPLMIQGDHGPVAFRNIRYKLLRDPDISAGDVTYKTFYGNYKTIADFLNQKPVETGTTKEITNEILDKENSYGAIYAATLHVPTADTYEFAFRFTGGGVVKIDGNEIINIQRPDAWVEDTKSVELKSGTHSLEIYNFKDVEWMPPLLGVWVQSSTMYPKALHAYNSFPPFDNPTSPILISAGGAPKLLRAFLDFKGDSKQRLTHTIGVADPSGINYVYDLKAGNLVCVWRGQFVDATPMWNDRGDGSFRPLGATQYLFTSQPLAFLENDKATFPAKSDENNFRGKGYAIDGTTGRPTFNYLYHGLEVSDQVFPQNDNSQIAHQIKIKNRGTEPGLYYKLAEGSVISEMPDGSFAVDKQYYIKVQDAKPIVRDADNKKELVVSVTGENLLYSIIW